MAPILYRRVTVVTFAALLLGAGIATAQTPAPPSGPFTVSAEALLWWFKGSPASTPLVADGPIGAPGTRVFLGGEDLDTNPNPGFRLTAAYAPTGPWGVEATVFYVPPRTTGRSVSSSGQPGSTDLVIPFFNVNTGREDVTSLSQAGRFAGSAQETLRNSLLGAELMGTWRIPLAGPWRVEALGGFRYLRLRETYTFSTSSPNIPPRPADVFQTTDEFDASNNFYGLGLGARAGADWGAWFVTGTVKVALGAMVQSVDIDGRLLTNDFNNFGPPQTLPGGYFAQPLNSGGHTRSVFAVVPEAALNLGYRITPWLSVVVGYTFLYANDVVRAPEQINRNINPTLSPAFTGDPTTPKTGPAQPTFSFKSSDFWAHGLNVGLAFRF